MSKIKKNPWNGYPPDNGLKEPVRELGDLPSVFDIVKKYFKLEE